MKQTIGTVSQETGVQVETIRYYEKKGLVPEPQRSYGGHRLYGPEDVERLFFIRRARELGFPLDEVRQLLELSEGSRNCGDVRKLAEHHLAEVRRKARDLRRLETALLGLTRECRQTSDDECPVLQALGSGDSPER